MRRIRLKSKKAVVLTKFHTDISQHHSLLRNKTEPFYKEIHIQVLDTSKSIYYMTAKYYHDKDWDCLVCIIHLKGRDEYGQEIVRASSAEGKKIQEITGKALHAIGFEGFASCEDVRDVERALIDCFSKITTRRNAVIHTANP